MLSSLRESRSQAASASAVPSGKDASNVANLPAPREAGVRAGSANVPARVPERGALGRSAYRHGGASGAKPWDGDASAARDAHARENVNIVLVLGNRLDQGGAL